MHSTYSSISFARFLTLPVIVIFLCQVQNPPTLSWSTKPDSLYAVFMMDPDAPSRKNPKKREWYHWGVLNIPGMDISNGETIAEYIGAGPPQKTGAKQM